MNGARSLFSGICIPSLFFVCWLLTDFGRQLALGNLIMQHFCIKLNVLFRCLVCLWVAAATRGVCVIFIRPVGGGGLRPTGIPYAFRMLRGNFKGLSAWVRKDMTARRCVYVGGSNPSQSRVLSPPIRIDFAYKLKFPMLSAGFGLCNWIRREYRDNDLLFWGLKPSINRSWIGSGVGFPADEL